MKLNKLLLGVAAAGLLALPGGASAQVDAWDYTVDANWENWTPPEVIHDTSDPDEDILRWGSPVAGPEQSQLRVTRHVSGTVVTNSDVGGPGVTITHHNSALIIGPSLEHTDLRIAATFTPEENGISDSFTQVFNIDFEETLNEAPCDPLSVSVCDDIFTLLNPADLVEEFSIGDGFIYTARLEFGPFSGGTIDESNPNVLRFLTQEGLTAVLQTRIFVTARPVPEPGAFALLGAGLAGLGFAARRRRKA